MMMRHVRSVIVRLLVTPYPDIGTRKVPGKKNKKAPIGMCYEVVP